MKQSDIPIVFLHCSKLYDWLFYNSLMRTTTINLDKPTICSSNTNLHFLTFLKVGYNLHYIWMETKCAQIPIIEEWQHFYKQLFLNLHSSKQPSSYLRWCSLIEISKIKRLATLSVCYIQQKDPTLYFSKCRATACRGDFIQATTKIYFLLFNQLT